MKRTYRISNFLLSGIVLFVILFQSLHSFEHLSRQLFQKVCLHEAAQSKSIITHQHQDFDDCFSCEFAFSNFIQNNTRSFALVNETYYYKNDSYFLQELNPFFSGIHYSLRGPPIFKIA